MHIPIVFGILIDLGIALGGVYLLKKLQKSQSRQPSLSRKIIKNLKF
tara:strand:- start:309 stop:449 length:141 start_codon:yes stop_codon:yes gene_type:complete